MAWGYERGFVIEHDDTLKRRIDCKSCCYYDKSDKSCMKRPLYLPVDGYNSWRNCKFLNWMILRAIMNKRESNLKVSKNVIRKMCSKSISKAVKTL